MNGYSISTLKDGSYILNEPEYAQCMDDTGQPDFFTTKEAAEKEIKKRIAAASEGYTVYTFAEKTNFKSYNYALAYVREARNWANGFIEIIEVATDRRQKA